MQKEVQASTLHMRTFIEVHDPHLSQLDSTVLDLFVVSIFTCTYMGMIKKRVLQAVHARTLNMRTLTEVHRPHSGPISCSGIVRDSPVITSMATWRSASLNVDR